MSVKATITLDAGHIIQAIRVWMVEEEGFTHKEADSAEITLHSTGGDAGNPDPPYAKPGKACIYATIEFTRGGA